jgi:hypothetical protein
MNAGLKINLGPAKMVKHGTYGTYFHLKCRCFACREYQRARVARNRAARLASGNLSHGSRSAYDAGCRCDQCLSARRASYPAEKSQRGQAKQAQR